MGGRGGGASATRAPQGPRSTDWRAASPLNEMIQFGLDISTPDIRPVPNVPLSRLDSAEDVLRDFMPRNQWVRFPKIRDRLSRAGYGIGEQDALINRMAVKRDVRVIPVANLKSLSRQDRQAAVHLGGEWNHAMFIE